MEKRVPFPLNFQISQCFEEIKPGKHLEVMEVREVKTSFLVMKTSKYKKLAFK